MRSRRSAAVVTTAVLIALCSVAPARAATGRTVAYWRMNESPGARTMVDSSGNGMRGTIGREVRAGVRVNGVTGYRFDRIEPDTPPARPGHLVTVPDRADLDPGTRDFTVSLGLRTTGKFGNIVQKGQATVAGGNYKLQIPNGIAQCMFRGSSGFLQVNAPRRINDGRWHLVRCTRTDQGLTLSIDGSTVARREGRTGRIANSWPLTIGGKTDCDQIEVGCDYYAGDLDFIEISAG
jgi:hypothetical protein